MSNTLTANSNASKYLFIVSSSYGHLFPAIRLAHLLQKRRKDVLFVSAREHKILFDTYGIKCISVSNQPNPFLSTYDWYDSEVGRYQYDVIKQVVDEYQPDTIVATPLVMPAFVLAEAHSIPLIVIGYCEYLFPSVGEKNSKKQWRIESITQHYNNLRENLCLPLIPADTATSPLIGNKYLLRSIPHFTTQENLPSQVEFVGSLIWEPKYINYDLDRFISKNRNNKRKRPLFFVQIGRLFSDRNLWNTLIMLLGKLPADFVVDLARSDYMRNHIEFPENFYLHPFVPLGYIKDDVCGVICSGQTTSVVSAIYYGKPILGIPNSADGAEVTDRIVENGIGAGIYQEHDIREDIFLNYFDKIEKGIYDDKRYFYQQHFLFYEEEDRLFEKSFA
ncbi:MAG: hypothetical protein EBE86_014215 [Hormoscilla sp. GUM202]|nr:hypothetical protein [Hormoscilla sp. GUM202]